MHDEFIWLDNPHKITKKGIHVVTGLAQIDVVPSLRKVSNDTVIISTGSKFDSRAMTIKYILENDVKFSSMVVGYKVYQPSRYNSIFGTAIYSTYEMLKHDKRYDLCTTLLNELLSNLNKIK